MTGPSDPGTSTLLLLLLTPPPPRSHFQHTKQFCLLETWHYLVLEHEEYRDQ